LSTWRRQVSAGIQLPLRFAAGGGGGSREQLQGHDATAICVPAGGTLVVFLSGAVEHEVRPTLCLCPRALYPPVIWRVARRVACDTKVLFSGEADLCAARRADLMVQLMRVCVRIRIAREVPPGSHTRSQAAEGGQQRPGHSMASACSTAAALGPVKSHMT
jgi:hypothetical protein